MSYFFSAPEIFEIAVQIEKNGYAFYSKAAETFTKPEHQSLLRQLAQMEVAHQHTFEELRAQLVAADQPPAWNDPENEAVRYLQAYAGGHVFNQGEDPTRFIKPETPLGEVLIEAIKREQSSILFYIGVKELVHENLGRPKIDAIIREEMGHITLLNDELEKLGGA